jgi:hypothetical protein
MWSQLNIYSYVLAKNITYNGVSKNYKHFYDWYTIIVNC